MGSKVHCMCILLGLYSGCSKKGTALSEKLNSAAEEKKREAKGSEDKSNIETIDSIYNMREKMLKNKGKANNTICKADKTSLFICLTNLVISFALIFQHFFPHIANTINCL